jgi:methylthioribose-1-phosphate isomerase
VNVYGEHYRTIWLSDIDPAVVQIIDQRHLPHRFVIEDLTTVEQVARAIKDMHVRGAGLIGAAAGYGMYLAALHAPRGSEAAFEEALRAAGEQLKATRPTAVNLEWMVTRQLEAISATEGGIEAKIDTACRTAQTIADEDAEFCRRIGEHGVGLIEAISQRKGGEAVNVLTHCNAGWLAFVDYGTATAPIYAAHDRGIAVHVWVDETRPRNQGARLTAWELGQHDVPHTVIADNVGGHLMQHGMVDLMITGTDRTLYTGDVANKIGTYLKALAARDNGVPFYVALPSSTFDWEHRDGVKEIPIEQRDATEVKTISGLHEGEIVSVQITPEDSPAANYAFDVTPARLVSGLITERGICEASEEGILALYPEKKPTTKKEA